MRLVSHGNRKYRLSVTVTDRGLAGVDGVNLSLAEIGELPVAAALIDAAGTVVARTPEWDGPGPGAVSYPVRSMRLVVRTQPASLALRRAGDPSARTSIEPRRLSTEPRRSACGSWQGSLRLVAGREVGGWGTTDDVIDLACAGIGARTALIVEPSPAALGPFSARRQPRWCSSSWP